jgi:transposase InsO family protein
LASLSLNSNQGHQSGAVSIDLAHARLGDSCAQTLYEMESQEAVDGLRIAIDKDRSPSCKCKVCVEANLRVACIPKRRTRTLRPLQVVGSDLQCLPTRSYDGKLYFAIYVDHATGFAVTVNLNKKSEQEFHTSAILRRLERMSIDGNLVVVFRADQGGEFTSENLHKELYAAGVRQEFSDTKMPLQNGLAEVIGGKLMAMARAGPIGCF